MPIYEYQLRQQLKAKGKAEFKGPDVKKREKFAPATKVEPPKKGKGSYNRKNFEEDNEDRGLGSVPMKPSGKAKSKYEFEKNEKAGPIPLRKKKKDVQKENTDIINFIECIMSKNYASANKYLNNAVELKIQDRIASEIETPLFQ